MPRAIWKGAITFGLVNIPVHMFTASREKELKFVMLHKKDLSQIRYARICKVEEREVPWDEIVKGYEYEKGEFVVLQDEDFQKANLKKVKSIEIFNFVKEDEIDTIYYIKPYYLEPDKNAEKAYSILREALKKTKKVALAKYIIHNHEYLAVVKVHENMLILNELRYETELVQTKDLNLPAPLTKASQKEIDLAIQLIDQQTGKFSPSEYSDTYMDEIKEIIRQKAKGRPVHPKTKETPPTKVHDLMALLQKSLKEKKKPVKHKRKIA